VPLTLVSLLIANTATVLTFGVLACSRIPRARGPGFHRGAPVRCCTVVFGAAGAPAGVGATAGGADGCLMMHTLADAAHAGRSAPTRVLIVAPRLQRPEDFVRAGFVGAVRQRRLEVDLVFAGLELQHVTDRTVLTRLHQELILPRGRQGGSLWLGGISLGVTWRCAARSATRGRSTACACSPPTWAVTS